MSDRFAEYQISASEALRAGGRPGLTPEERIAFFQEAQNWAGKAFLEAKENTYDRYLAICQYTCAAGEVLLVMSGYESVMLSGEPLTQPSIPITRRNGDAR